MEILGWGFVPTPSKWNLGVGICPRALERQTIIVSICNVECAFEPRGGCNLLYYLLAAIGAVNGMFAYYPHSGGQA